MINPPVDVSRFRIGEKKKEYFLMVTKFEPSKRVDLAVKAFNELGYPLKIVGSTGRLRRKVRKGATKTIFEQAFGLDLRAYGIKQNGKSEVTGVAFRR